MKVAVLGSGNAGSAIAADLARKGHDVTICKTSRSLHNDHFEMINCTGEIVMLENGSEYHCPLQVTTDLQQAVSGKDIVVIFIQTNYHERLIEKISSFLEDDQILLIEPGYLSSCFMVKHCKKAIVVAEAESSPIDCRIVEPGKVKVLFRNVRNPIGVYAPAGKSKEEAFEKLSGLDFHFELLDSIAEAALHNPNLIVHTVGAIMSVPRIEYVAKVGGTYSMYREVFTPMVWNLATALDVEKMNVLSALGCKRVPYVEACKHRNSLDDDRDAEEVFFDYAMNSSPDGPDRADSRYVTEDVSQGLVLLESLGEVLKVPTPVTTSLITVASSLLNRDFRAEGRTVNRLGMGNVRKVLE